MEGDLEWVTKTGGNEYIHDTGLTLGTDRTKGEGLVRGHTEFQRLLSSFTRVASIGRLHVTKSSLTRLANTKKVISSSSRPVLIHS